MEKLEELARQPSANAAGLRLALGNLSGVLKTLGFENLRPGQDEAIFNLFLGLDTLLLLPTGSGKSAVYIIPTLCMGYRTLIFSPLIALMKNQVEVLWRYGLKAGVINSSQGTAENAMMYSEWESGALNFLFVAPERLQDVKFWELMSRMPPDMLVVDEAHVASAWSDSFRPDYKKIGDMVSVLKPKSVLALTATATPEVEEDVRHILHIEEAKRVLYLPQRNNLHLSSEDFRSDGQIYQAIAAIEGQSICYCATVKRVNELYASMGGSIKGGATCYTGKMTPAERDAAQNAFMCGDVNCVFATNAFGLGIDRSCIRGIVHADAPASLDALSQEQGRAGRDGLDAYCTAFFSDKAYGTQLYFIDVRYPEAEIVRRVYAYLKTHADKAGIVKMTIEQIAGAVGERSDGAGAAMSILANFKVLDRSKDSDSVHNVRFVKPHLQEEYARFVPAIEKIGFKNDRGFWEFDVTALAEALSLKPKKVADSLKDLSTNGYIQWTAPFRGKISRIVGNVDLVDFDYLARRRELSIKRLGILWKYHRVPDESKHDFISEYFRNGTA